MQALKYKEKMQSSFRNATLAGSKVGAVKAVAFNILAGLKVGAPAEKGSVLKHHERGHTSSCSRFRMTLKRTCVFIAKMEIVVVNLVPFSSPSGGNSW